MNTGDAIPVAAYDASNMCNACGRVDGFSMPAIGSICTTVPPDIRTPVGGVHPGVDHHDEHGRSRSASGDDQTHRQMRARRDAIHPYRYTPRKMASVKNANPSSENGRPTIGPANYMNFGQSSPSSNDNTVPETAPTANSTAVPLAHRLAS